MITTLSEYKKLMHLKQLNETLKTYPIDKLKSDLENRFKYNVELLSNFNKNGNIIFEILFNYETLTKSLIKEILYRIEVYGYFVNIVKLTNKSGYSNSLKFNEFKKSLEKNNNFLEYISNMSFIVEPLNDMKRLVDTNNIFHITDEKHIDNIQKIGLVCKSKNTLSYHPSRIYFTDNIEDSKKYAYKRKNILNLTHYILEINIYDLNINFYSDPNMLAGFYCYDNIQPDRIKIIETI